MWLLVDTVALLAVLLGLAATIPRHALAVWATVPTASQSTLRLWTNLKSDTWMEGPSSWPPCTRRSSRIVWCSVRGQGAPVSHTWLRCWVVCRSVLARPTLLLPTHRLRCLRGSGQELTLLYGHPSIGAPRYDLALPAPQVIGARAHEVTPAPEALPADRRTKQGATIVSQTQLFWGALIVAVVVLLDLEHLRNYLGRVVFVHLIVFGVASG